MFSPVVTGATGFVGRTLVTILGKGATALPMRSHDWERGADSAALRDATLFHLAGRAHDPHADEADYVRDNVDKTRALARLAARAGARRIVFLSSIKVNGEETAGRPFTRSDPPAPQDAYGRSKLGAEEALREECARGGIESVVVRSPLVYGRGAAGNLRALVRLADTPWPLPFASLSNARSFVHVEDLCSCLAAAGTHGGAAGQTYLVAHEHAPSTRELVTRLREKLGRAPRLYSMPPAALEAAASLLGRGERARRLTRSLAVDASAARQELGWTPRRSLDDALADLLS